MNLILCLFLAIQLLYLLEEVILIIIATVAIIIIVAVVILLAIIEVVQVIIINKNRNLFLLEFHLGCQDISLFLFQLNPK